MSNKANILKALATGVTIFTSNPLLADDTTNSQVATIVANGDSIDFNNKLSQINSQIQLLNHKILIIEQKNQLTIEDKRERYKLQKEIRQLKDEKLAIKKEIGNQLDRDKAIIDKDTTLTNANLETERYKGKKLDEIKNILDKQSKGKPYMAFWQFPQNCEKIIKI